MATVTTVPRKKKNRDRSNSRNANSSSKSNKGNDSKKQKSPSPNELPSPVQKSWREKLSTSAALSIISGLLLFAAFPPIGAWPLAWLAPVGWIWLIGRKQLFKDTPKTKTSGASKSGSKFSKPKKDRTLVYVWFGCFLQCLLMYHFVRLPHWLGYFGWVLLASYLSIYLFGFVMVSRIAVHKFKIPILFTAPVVWTGFEVFRSYFATGVSIGLLAHSQYLITPLIQVSDLCGGYTLSFLMILYATGLVGWFQHEKIKLKIVSGAVSLIVLFFVLGYGIYRTSELTSAEPAQPPRIALIQGSMDTIFPKTVEEAEQRWMDIFKDYQTQTELARDEHENIDLIVWPETMFPIPEFHSDEKNLSAEDQQELLKMQQVFETTALTGLGTLRFDDRLKTYKQVRLPVRALLGTETKDFHSISKWNSAALLDGAGKVQKRYHKMHLVFMGEYIPLGDWFPFLYNFAPISSALESGTQPETFEVNGLKLSPNICFESTVPHLIRNQLNTLRSTGNEPDVLVNITNDGWFHGSNALDLHFACNVFRSVENRKPTLISANTGISGWIDGSGTVRKRTEKQTRDVVIAEPRIDGRVSPYRSIGDWPGYICIFFIAMILIGAIWQRRFQTSGD